MENILVTGGAGYIGSVLVEELLNLDYNVTVYDNFKYNQDSLMHLCARKNLEIVNADVRDHEKLNTYISKNDIVIPLAAIVGAPACKKLPAESFETNFSSIQFLVKQLSKDQKIIFPVTNSGYGVGEKDIFCDEKSKLRPISEYGKQKVMAEQVVMEHGNSVSFRLATVFGASPRMRLDLLVNDFVYRACTDSCVVLFEEHFKRNYIHIRDVSGAFIFALNNFGTMKENVYNHGLNEANISKRELADLIKEFIPGFHIISSPIGEDPDKRNYIVSNDKLKNTGFTNKYSLSDGIIELKKLYSFLKNNKYNNL